MCERESNTTREAKFRNKKSRLKTGANNLFGCLCSENIYSMKNIKFYFDAISPYAWLAWRPLQTLVQKHDVKLEIVPVLFAGLLKANGQLGPAEIPNKRLWLMTDVMRRAHSRGNIKFVLLASCFL